MSENMNLSTFTENTLNPSLSRAVIEQFGHWVDWEEYASDIEAYGAKAGFNRFTDPVHTVEFYEANKGDIHAMARDMAYEIAETNLLSEFVANSNYINLEPYEVEQALEDGYSNEDYTQVANALVWFVLEETARSYVSQAGED